MEDIKINCHKKLRSHDGILGVLYFKVYDTIIQYYLEFCVPAIPASLFLEVKAERLMRRKNRGQSGYNASMRKTEVIH
jgi:hypothetical protein